MRRPLDLDAAFDAGFRARPLDPPWLGAALGERFDMPTLARLTSIVHAQTEFVPPLLQGFGAPGDEQRWDELVGWLAHALSRFALTDDRPDLRLAAMLVLVGECGLGEAFWRRLQDVLAPESRLCDALAATLARFQAEAHVPDDAPLWERQHLERLRAADAAQDWAELNERLRAFDQQLLPPTILRQSARALAILAPDRLARGVEACPDILSAYLLALALSPEAALGAALAAGPRFAFAALRRSVSGSRRPDLGQAAEFALQALLSRLTADQILWPEAMRAFNRYPVRYPRLQRPLGAALAHAPPEALADYVDAVELTNSSADGGVQVAGCLEAFRAAASPDQRRLLWRRAYDRWRAWDFGGPQQALGAITRSELDYPAVGWLLEGEPGDSSAGVEATIRDLATLEEAWHASKFELTSANNRLLSRLQLFAHAAGDAASGDWLPDRRQYRPSGDQADFAQQRRRSTRDAWPAARR